MSDKELLELAAKAAGYRVRWLDAFTSLHRAGFRMKTGNVLPGGLGDIQEEVSWNPLSSDGDALRLAVKLNLTIVNEPHECEVFSEGECLASEPILRLSMVATSAEVTDPCAATRRAIVRAAAEIGKTHD